MTILTVTEAAMASPVASEVTRPSAEWLLAWVMTKEQREDVLGDLLQEYLTDKVPVHGPRWAKVWFWSQIARSFWPFLRAGVQRAITVAMLVKLFRRLGL